MDPGGAGGSCTHIAVRVSRNSESSGPLRVSLCLCCNDQSCKLGHKYLQGLKLMPGKQYLRYDSGQPVTERYYHFSISASSCSQYSNHTHTQTHTMCQVHMHQTSGSTYTHVNTFKYGLTERLQPRLNYGASHLVLYYRMCVYLIFFPVQ